MSYQQDQQNDRPAYTPRTWPPPQPKPSSKRGCYIAAGAGCGVMLVGGGGLLAFIILTALLITAPAVESTDAFLAKMGSGKLHAAYKSTDPSLQVVMDEDVFIDEAQQLGFTSYASSSWTNRSVDNDRATMEGKITTTDGTRVPVTITLVKLGGQWKVSGFSGQKGLVTTPINGPDDEPDHSSGGMPKLNRLKEIAKQAVLELHISIITEDFEAFHKYISKTWREQTTAEELRAAFQGFIDTGVDMGGVEEAEPVFGEEPYIDDDGLLCLVGNMPASPVRVTFDLKFIKELEDWRLFSIGVEVETDETIHEKMPGPDEINKMVEEALLILNHSIRAKDFSIFHKYISRTLRNEMGPKQLQEAFQDFIDNPSLDLSKVKGKTPAFDPEPYIDKRGDLHVSGHYPTRPNQVAFELTYSLEKGAWKLVGIGVEMN